MAIYGVDYYGSSRYGQVPFISFDASPFIAINSVYNRVDLMWNTPTGAWTELRLVRSAVGYPVREDDGIILVDTDQNTAVTTYTDLDIQGGKFYYYAIYVYVPSTLSWYLAGSTLVLAVKNFDMSGRMFNLLPAIFQSSDVGSTGGDNATLKNFLTIFGYQLDHIRTEYESLTNIYNLDKVSGNLLPVLAKQLGVAYEGSLGQKQARVYVRNAVYNSQQKGTALGVQSVCKSYTGWDAKVSTGINLMLDYNDSSFEESLGRWRVSSTTTNITLSRGTTGGFAYADAGFANKQVGFAVVTATGTPTNIMLHSAGPYTGTDNTLVLQGIPVTAGLAYSASAYFRSAVTSRQPTINIQWYDRKGIYLSDSALGTSPATNTSSWTRGSVANQIAPTNATYARIQIQYPTMVSGEVQYFDALQLEQSATVNNFQEARDTRIILVADRINQVLNPSFEVNTTGWTSGVNSPTVARSTAQFYSGTASLLLTATAIGDMSVSTTFGALKPNTSYAISWYVLPNVTRRFYADLTATNFSASTLGNLTVATTNAFTRITATFTTNATITGNTTVNFHAVPTGAGTVGDTVYMDAVMVEQGLLFKGYFDGDSYASTNQADFLWEGTPGNSRSHQYQLYGRKNYRLRQLLPNYTPSGSTFTLLYAQPNT